MSDETPTGLPDDDAEAPPLGVPADEDADGAENADGAEKMPGIPTEGEPPSAG
jgi:hypothetical protein